MPSALITGITGQDGSYLAERLVDDGWTLHALVRRTVDPGETVVDVPFERHVGDLADAEALTALVEEVAPDAVFNLAGISSVARSWDEPVATMRVSALAVGALLEGAWRAQQSSGRAVAFIQASSAEMFGDATEQPQRETTPIRPASPYGAAKAAAHHLVGVYRARGLRASAAILYNHESPRRPLAFVTRKITRGAADIAAGRADSLALGNLTARRDWGWAPDYVDAMVRMAAAETADDYVIATGEAHSVEEFVEAAFTAAGIEDWRRYVHQDPRFMRPTDSAVLVGDSTKARAGLGWAPTRRFRDVVAAMVEHDLAGS